MPQGVLVQVQSRAPILYNIFRIFYSIDYFVRSGWITIGGYYGGMSQKAFRSSGQNGDYWSLFAHSYSSFAYYLSFAGSGVTPSNSSSSSARSYGLSLRCLAS